MTTCPDCQVTLACDDLDDHACAGNITCSACGKSMTSEEYHNHNCHSSWSGGGYDEWGYTNPPEDTPPTTDPTPNNPPFQEEEDIEDFFSEDAVGTPPPSSQKYVNVSDLKYVKGIHLCTSTNLPNNFHPQILKRECAVRGYAFAMELLGYDYENAYTTLRQFTDQKDIDLENVGIYTSDFDNIFGVFCNYSVKDFSISVIEEAIDSHHPVLGIVLQDGEYHMATIVGYDSQFYYTASGDSKSRATIYHKNEFAVENIYIVNDIKAPFK